MTAGSGLLHIEEPPEDLVMSGGLFHGFQLWVNLPARLKMAAPRYQDVQDRQVALLSSADGGALIRVIAGDIDGHAGPGSTHTPIALLHVTVERGTSTGCPGGATSTRSATCWRARGRGRGRSRRPVRTGQLAVFGPGDAITLGAQRSMDGPSEKLDVLILGGQPIREPVAAYGPFVMNPRAAAGPGVEDFQAGRLGSIQAVRTPLPEEPHPGHDVL